MQELSPDTAHAAHPASPDAAVAPQAAPASAPTAAKAPQTEAAPAASAAAATASSDAGDAGDVRDGSTSAVSTEPAAPSAASAPPTDASPDAAEAPSDATDGAAAPRPERAARADRADRGNRAPGKGSAKAGGSARRNAPHPVLEQLFGLYPALFGARFQPLKLGIFEDLMARHPEVLTKADLKVALGLHARSNRYLDCVAAGLPRRDLDGGDAGPVAPEHVHHAIMELHRRRQGRNPAEDLRPALLQHLARAIAASGLDRAEYIERVRATDDAALALVDEAFALHQQAAAKREALQRAFEASGSSVADFAAMYGLDPREAALTLHRA